MKRFIGSALVFAVAMTMISGCVRVEKNVDPDKIASEISQEIEMDPKDNFYNYVNGKSLMNSKIKYGKDYADDGFDQDVINDRIRVIIDDVVAGDGYEKGSEEDIVKTAYEYYLNYDFEGSDVPEDIKEMLEEIKNADSMDELMKADAKVCSRFGLQSILKIEIEGDISDSKRKSILFDQYTGILNADFEELTHSFDPLEEVKAVGTDGSKVVFDKEKADKMGLDLANLVLNIYMNSDMEIVRTTNPFKYIKVYDKDEITDVFSGFDVIGYLEEMGFDESHLDRFMVFNEEQLKYLGQVFTDENLDAVKAWELSRFENEYMDFIAPSYDVLKIYDSIDYKDLDTQAEDKIMNLMTAEVDPLYVEVWYDEETDNYIRSMCDDIKESYRVLITEADWLSEQTRNDLLIKLDNIIYKTGMDLKRQDPNEYKDICGDNWYELVKNYKVKKNQESMDSLKREQDRTIPGMDMVVVNACYEASLNTITINTGILIYPMFDINADYYTNLGGIGMVIAHEMGHAFDSNCIYFDMNGNYDPSWISEKDVATLEERNKTAISYFEDNFTIFEVYHVNGEQTLGENYADLGAMECLMNITKNKEDREKLFINYAKIWSSKTTSENLMTALETDEHSPSILRVNSILSTTNEFYETYGVKEGDGMYVAPEKRISRWH